MTIAPGLPDSPATAPRGPCGLCGHPDARHRVWEAMLERFIAGEMLPDLADDYGMTVAEVLWHLEWAVDERMGK